MREVATGIRVSKPQHKTKNTPSKIDALREIIGAWGSNPEELLTRDALVQPDRTAIDQGQLEIHQLSRLTTALRQQMLKEIRENQPQKTYIVA